MIRVVPISLCILLASALVGASAAARSAGVVTVDDVLSTRNGQFYLDGRPFAEISFNKFDLFWQLWDEANRGEALEAGNFKYDRQEKALKDLHDMGFRTIRVFGHPWSGVGFREVFDDLSTRESVYFRALDAVFDLCEKYDMKVIFCLGCADFTDKVFDPAVGFVQGDEHLRELVADPSSHSRKRLYEYLDVVIPRYKARKSVAMWEICNELTLNADIQPGTRVHAGERMPTLKDVSRFYGDVTAHIKGLDGLRLVNNGGSNLREYAWNLANNKGWRKDSTEEHAQAFNLVWGDSPLDVVDIHYYSIATGGIEMRSKTKQKVFIDLKWYMEAARSVGKPLMVGEIAALPTLKSDKAFWKATPNYFESFDDASARAWVQKAVDEIVDAGVPLSHWWCYQSDREMDQGLPNRMDIETDRNPALVQLIVEANKRLKTKLGTN